MELPDWNERIVVCIATGPSLTREQVECACAAAEASKKMRVLAVNDAGLPEREPFTVPSCDLWYASDHRFWAHYREVIDRRRAIRVGAEHRSKAHGLVHALLRDVQGGHAGYQAITLALSLGAEVVLLLGYDCRAQGHQTNYFGRKPPELEYSRPESYAAWVPRYRKLYVPPGSRVINCTPGSAIDAFEFSTIEAELGRRLAA